jgi:glycosyltransferase involved in cell wall biosynthesis
MRVALLIPSLGSGGAERVMTLLAEGLVGRGHDVWLVTLAAAGDEFFAVDPRVQRVGLDLMAHSQSFLRALEANLQRVYALRRTLSNINPEAVVSFMTSMNVLTVLACIGRRAQVVVSERIDPTRHREQWLWAALRAIAYRRVDAVVVQTEAAAQWFRRRLGKRAAVIVIPNPVAPRGEPRDQPLTVPKPFVLAAGRLVHQKGFDVLIRAFAQVARECERLRLAIAGEGPAGPALRSLVGELRLDDRVLFLGQVMDLRSLMQDAEAFVLSSRYEGFPNVLLEALSTNLPVVSTDCPGGPREILHDGEFGLLVPCENPTALAAAVRRVVTDAELRRRLSGIGIRATAHYELRRVVQDWEVVLSGARP